MSDTTKNKIFKKDLYKKFLLFSLIPLLFISIFFIILLIKEKYDLISSSHASMIQNIEYNINIFNQEIKEIPNFLKEIRKKERQKILDNILKYKNFIETIIIVDQKGIIQEISSRKKIKVFPNFDYSRKKIFKEYMKKKKDFLSNIYFSNITDSPLISYIFEFHKQIYIVELNLDFIKKLVSNLNYQKRDSLSVTIVDKNGLYILDTENSSNVKEGSLFFTSKLYKEVVSKNPENTLIAHYNNVLHKNNYITYKKFDKFSWTIILDEHNHKIYGYIINIILLLLIIILIIIFISVQSAKKIANNIVKPLELLTLNINNFSKDHSVKIDDNLQSKYTMFITLISNFKLMQKSIFENEKSLQEQIVENKKKDKILYEQSKMVAMGEMIGNIAHQWRQPLSVISTASTGIIMQKKFGIFDEDTLIPTCNTINDNAQYLSKTIDDFKNFIKGDRTKKIFSLKDNIHHSLKLLESTIKSHSITIICDLEEDIVIDGYDNELTQCIINIINNAKDALQSKREMNRCIFITTFKKDDKAIIKIKDNAQGIAKNVLPHIFEPYFTTKHKSQGTGLGLHMTYNLITDGMKGTIEAQNITYVYKNKTYSGTEFTICL